MQTDVMRKDNLQRWLQLCAGRRDIILAVVMLLFAVIPGFPFIYFFIMAVITALPCALLWYRARHPQAVSAPQGNVDDDQMVPGAQPLTLRLAPRLHSESLSLEVDALRKTLFNTLGVPLPDVSIIVDASMTENSMAVLVYQESVFSLMFPVAAADAIPEAHVLLQGMGRILWLSAAEGQSAQQAGQTVFTGDQCLIALLHKVLVNHMAEFIGVQEARYLMDAMEKRYAELVKELQRQMPINKIAEMLQRLVSERVSIRDLRLVFGMLIEWAPREKDVQMLTEYVRIGEEMENVIRESIRQTAMGTYTALSHEQRAQIFHLITEAQTAHGEFVILSSVDTRRFLRKLIEQQHTDIAVLSWQEVGEHCLLQVVHSIDLNPEHAFDDED